MVQLLDGGGSAATGLVAAGWGAHESISLVAALGTLALAAVAYWQMLHLRQARRPLIVQVRHNPAKIEQKKVVFVRAARGTPAFEAEATHEGEVVFWYADADPTPIVGGAYDTHPHGPLAGISIPIQNIGPGLAYITRVSVVDTPWSDDAECWPDDTAVPTGGTTRLNILVHRDYYAVTNGGRLTSFACEVQYHDVVKRQAATTRFRLSSQGFGPAPIFVVERQVCRRAVVWGTVTTTESRIGLPPRQDG
jgi:hypothetical protein